MLFNTKVVFFVYQVLGLTALAAATPTQSSANQLERRQYKISWRPRDGTVNAPPPGCVWYGTAPFCNGQCPSGQTLLAWNGCANGACCTTGLKVLCCQ
ncbi:hypothetical protein CPC08DRAFT_344134 [Agrocybe pediades]|nr:hypothetical protein CPC08DRAFT_344134 [Agrocybe pediades]